MRRRMRRDMERRSAPSILPSPAKPAFAAESQSTQVDFVAVRPSRRGFNRPLASCGHSQTSVLSPPPLTIAPGMAYHMLVGIARDARAFHATAHSLGEASAENKGHGPETSRDADGQDRWRRLKAQPPVAEGNTSTSRGAKARPGRGRSVLPPMRDPGDPTGERPEP